ncbi:hypothetical protein AAIA72_15860 [Hahella sp. SMD15-11]|uniref:GNAT family N-acetyltransferase n=1 Tax=Thermohahella caldifontis TaxID=3142973 RepID=A0AB39UW50_9GAMM
MTHNTRTRYQTLNQFLQRYAFVNQKANSAQTCVCCQGDVVVGFYSRAVDKAHQRKDLSRALLKDLKAMLS